jgi:hypothetical protein
VTTLYRSRRNPSRDVSLLLPILHDVALTIGAGVALADVAKL